MTDPVSSIASAIAIIEECRDNFQILQYDSDAVIRTLERCRFIANELNEINHSEYSYCTVCNSEGMEDSGKIIHNEDCELAAILAPAEPEAPQ